MTYLYIFLLCVLGLSTALGLTRTMAWVCAQVERRVGTFVAFIVLIVQISALVAAIATAFIWAMQQ